MVPSIFAAIVVLAGLLSSRTAAVYWQMVFCLFGAAAAVTLTAIGSAVVTPANLFLPFLILRAWIEEHHEHYLRRVPIAGIWLGCAVSCGLLGAAFIPRLFAGDVMILTVDRIAGGLMPTLMPLGPVSGNITQSAYAVGGLAAFLSMRALLEKRSRMTHFSKAVLLLAALNCAAALINLAEFRLGLPKILTYVRNAYAIFDAYEGAGGLMRIHGTFPETSGFAAFTLPLFAFTFSLWMNRERSWLSGTLAFTSLGLLLISTSTTAYVGVALYGAMLIFVLTYRRYQRGSVPRIGLLVAGSLLFVVLVGSFFVFDTQIAAWLEDYLEVTVVNKLESDSGAERSSWNSQAWLNFLETYGLGVGLGSARASSLVLVLLSNLGALGTLFFVAFCKRVVGNLGIVSDPVSEASRQAFLASIAAAIVSAAVFDLGITFYAYAAASSLAGSPAAVQAYARTYATVRFAGAARG